MRVYFLLDPGPRHKARKKIVFCCRLRPHKGVQEAACRQLLPVDGIEAAGEPRRIEKSGHCRPVNCDCRKFSRVA